MASLSRSMAGVRGRTLILNLPGSPTGALESFEAIAGVLRHAIETLAGPYDHAGWGDQPPTADPAGPEGSADR
jgi:molybdopterin adenylyltransferase